MTKRFVIVWKKNKYIGISCFSSTYRKKLSRVMFDSIMIMFLRVRIINTSDSFRDWFTNQLNYNRNRKILYSYYVE